MSGFAHGFLALDLSREEHFLTGGERAFHELFLGLRRLGQQGQGASRDQVPLDEVDEQRRRSSRATPRPVQPS